MVKLYLAKLKAAKKERRQWTLVRNRADRALAKLDTRITTLENKIAHLEITQQRTGAHDRAAGT